ncbi:lipoyl(octanoyl) transferase [Spizellomyces sp. 'palustris']|nr:lipoyl(octanoyl) transferase [Spizellomyces sp. 'palustris']
MEGIGRIYQLGSYYQYSPFSTLSPPSNVYPAITIGYKYLGKSVSYSAALELQDQLVASRTSQRDIGPDAAHNVNVLLLLEHSPTYTAGRRVRNTDATEGRRLRALGAEYYETRRGGQTTFHGPGQLVGYPILDLRQLGLGVGSYVQRLEHFLILTCEEWGIAAATTEDTGVWVTDRKIAALGIQVRKHITSHGFALNCNTDLSWYNHIVPCGLLDKGVTSITNEIALKNNGEADVSVETVIPHAVNAFGDAFSAHMLPLNEVSKTLDCHIDALLGK